MSDVLTSFIEPYIEFADSKEDHEKLLMLAIVAWNASFLSEKEQQKNKRSSLLRNYYNKTYGKQ